MCMVKRIHPLILNTYFETKVIDNWEEEMRSEGKDKDKHDTVKNSGPCPESENKTKQKDNKSR